MPRPSLVPRVTGLIIGQVRDGKLVPGQHLPSQTLANEFRLSRAPVTAALKALEQAGIVRSEPNRGFFLADAALDLVAAQPPASETADPDEQIYLKIAEDRLAGQLPDRVSEAELMRLYGVARPRLTKVLYRIADEGWASRLPGNGWEFHAMLTSRTAYEQAYHFRAAIETEALRQSSFAVDEDAFARAREEQLFLQADGHQVLSRAEIFRANCDFHEMLMACSGNEFFLNSLQRVNRLRRLIEYQITLDRSRLPLQAREHVVILDLLVAGHREAASVYIRQHILGASAIKSPQVGLREDCT